MADLTTERLIEICERGVVPVARWLDRDTPDAQAKLGKAWAYLKAGCQWRAASDPKSDERTVWIEIKHPTFTSIEWRGSGEHDDEGDWELFYLPTIQRLDERTGRDWY